MGADGARLVPVSDTRCSPSGAAAASSWLSLLNVVVVAPAMGARVGRNRAWATFHSATEAPSFTIRIEPSGLNATGCPSVCNVGGAGSGRPLGRSTRYTTPELLTAAAVRPSRVVTIERIASVLESWR